MPLINEYKLKKNLNTLLHLIPLTLTSIQRN